MKKRNSKYKRYAINLVTKMLQAPLEVERYGLETGICERTVQYFIQDIKRAGFDVVVDCHSYKIKKMEEKLELEEQEASVLAYFLMLSCFLLPQYKTEVLCRVLEKILLISNRTELINTFKKFDYFKMASFNIEFGDKLRALEKYIIEKNVLKIITKTNQEFYLKPIEFEWEQGTIIVKFMDEDKRTMKNIALEDIVKIIPKGVRDYTPRATETFFKLKGRLAKSYLLKDDERIIESFDDEIVIANGNSEKEELFARLLKYGELCEIILPMGEREDFKNIINRSLENLKGKDT